MSGPDQTPQMPDDRELEEFLAGRGKVREAYRAGAQEQPPAAVDDAILQMAAKAAAETSTVAARKPRASRRWQPSLAAAAVLVLSLGVFFQVKQDPVAERAVFAPAADALTQELSITQPVAPPAPSAASEHKQKKALAQEDQARRQKREMKEDMAAASGAMSMAAPAPVAEAEMAPSLAKASPESERQNFALQDSASPRPASPPPPPAATAGKMLRAAPERGAISMAPAPTIEMEPVTGLAGNDLWAQICSSDMAFNAPSADKLVSFKTPQQWHGLSVLAFGAGALVFAPDVSREAILQRLDAAQDAAAACVEPIQKGHGARLLCRCVKP